MRNRMLFGRLAVLSAACLLTTVMLTGCGGGNGTYNPALNGGGSSAPTPSFTLVMSPLSATVAPGQSTNYTATVTSVNGFSSPVTFSVSGLPAGALASFGPTSVTPTANGATEFMAVATSGATLNSVQASTKQSGQKSTRDATPDGTYALTVTAKGGGVTQQATVTLTVQSGPIFTPEPGPLALLLTSGITTAGFLLRRRRRISPLKP